MRKLIDLTGQKFGRLTVIKTGSKDKKGKHRWLCKCECRNTKEVRGSSLRSGRTRSCGCLKREIRQTGNSGRIHGMWGSREYFTWMGMKKRCFNKNDPAYKNYGGRSITVCKEWLGRNGFVNFYEDMGKRLSGTSIDRINNNLGYFKENCRWATRKQQQRNKRNNKLITYKGKTLCLAEWSEKLNIKYYTIQKRLHYGWSIEKAFNNN